MARSLIFITGAPQTGKSHAGLLLAEEIGGDVFALSDILKAMTHEHFGIQGIPSGFFEKVKDLPNPMFDGLTPRAAYIWYSESVIKPTYGSDALGQWAVERLMRNLELQRPTIITGVGFEEEVRPLVSIARPENSIAIAIVSDQSKTIGDSRKPIDFAAMGVEQVSIWNCFSPSYNARVLDHAPTIAAGSKKTGNLVSSETSPSL